MALFLKRAFSWTSGLGALALLYACGGGGTGPGVPSNITLNTTSISFTAVGQTRQLSPTVTDEQGNPLSSATVTWTSSDAGVATVSSNGLVTAQSSGTAQVAATAGSATAVAQIEVAITSSFNIEVRFVGSVTASQRQAFAQAQARWEDLITGDLEDVHLTAAADSCGANSPAIDDTIDDLLIFASVDTIDGPGGVLATAGPCFIRNSNSLSVLGSMRFDAKDLADIEASGLLQAVVLHEMGHVLGFGSLWDTQGLLADASLPPTNGTDPHFTGPQAIAGFNSVGGGAYAGNKVPVEDTGGEGTADGHWRESVMGNELMTGFIDPDQNPLSKVTVASLADEGYAVNLAGADPYSLSLSLRASSTRPMLQLGKDLLRLPIKRVDGQGRVVGLFRR